MLCLTRDERRALVFAAAVALTGVSLKSMAYQTPKAVTERAASSHKKTKQKKEPVIVDVNKATETELIAVKGIGPSMARSIIETRVRGSFRSIEDLDRVKGIGPKKLEALRPYLRVYADAPQESSS
jgi:competence protein ComEA